MIVGSSALWLSAEFQKDEWDVEILNVGKPSRDCRVVNVLFTVQKTESHKDDHEVTWPNNTCLRPREAYLSRGTEFELLTR